MKHKPMESLVPVLILAVMMLCKPSTDMWDAVALALVAAFGIALGLYDAIKRDMPWLLYSKEQKRSINEYVHYPEEDQL